MAGRWLMAILAMSLAGTAAAHDFWIAPDRFHFARPGTVEARFLVGEAAAPEPWVTLWRKIVSLRDYGPDGVVDEQAGIRPDAGGRPGGATIRLDRPGTHIIAFETHQAENDLPADAFTAYARHEGLTPALEQRAAAGTSATHGRELYSRRAKALVQVGVEPTGQVTRPVGQTLEIVPERNPYASGGPYAPGGGGRLPVRLLYHGRPLAGATVTIDSLDDRAVPAASAITDAGGRASLPFRRRGGWRIAAVWTEPTDHPRAEFDTVFSTLTFGF